MQNAVADFIGQEERGEECSVRATAKKYGVARTTLTRWINCAKERAPDNADDSTSCPEVSITSGGRRPALCPSQEALLVKLIADASSEAKPLLPEELCSTCTSRLPPLHSAAAHHQ